MRKRQRLFNFSILQTYEKKILHPNTENQNRCSRFAAKLQHHPKCSQLIFRHQSNINRDFIGNNLPLQHYSHAKSSFVTFYKVKRSIIFRYLQTPPRFAVLLTLQIVMAAPQWLQSYSPFTFK